MITPSLQSLEQKLEAAKAKLGRLKQRSFSLKKRLWQRKDDRVVKSIHQRLQQSTQKTP